MKVKRGNLMPNVHTESAKEAKSTLEMKLLFTLIGAPRVGLANGGHRLRVLVTWSPTG